MASRWELLASLLLLCLLPPAGTLSLLPPSLSARMTKPANERRSGGENAVQDECDKRAVKIMSGGRGRRAGAGVCAECVRVCEDAIARRMFLLILNSELICDFLLAKEVATLIVSFPFLYLFYRAEKKSLYVVGRMLQAS